MNPARRLAGVAGAPLRAARLLHNRWRRLAPHDRERLDDLAGTVKQRALDLRGTVDRDDAERELEQANRELADAIVDCAEADPEVDEIEVRRLRSDLARELERLASADIDARASDESPAKPAPWL